MSLESEPTIDFVNCYDTEDFSLNDEWYYIAILDLTTCSNFDPDHGWIAKRLGLSRTQVTDAIARLEKAGLLKFENGTFKKVEDHLVIPTVVSRQKVRRYHKTMLLKAIDVMETQTTVDEFQKRLIKGSTIAVNPKNIGPAKYILERALEDAILVLSEGNCTELYHCNVQLFPLSKPERKK